MKKKFLILFLILLLGTFFRFYRLNEVPPSPSLDEVSIGWNAYSILKTGKDEYGYQFPVLLRAYDDWRPALYVYLTIPFIKVLGLSTASVRLPAVLLSLTTILGTYFLVKELFKNSRFTVYYSLITSFLLAISPWHIYLSRLGHEVGAGLTFSVLAVLFFLKWLHSNTLGYRTRIVWLILTVFFFALSFYTYQSQKVFGPLLILALALIFRKQLRQFKKEIVFAGLLGLILLIPILKASLSPGGLIRFQGSSIFSEHTTLKELSALRIARDYQQHSSLGLIFDNQQVVTGLTLLTNYLSHFNPSWLFFNAGEERHKIPGLGYLYLWELPLLLVGAYQLIKEKFSKETKLLIFSWIAVASLPASIATQTPHGMRAFNMLPIFQIIAAVGTVSLLQKINTKRIHKILVFGLTVMLLIGSFAYLYHNYFFNFPYEQSSSFQYPLSRAIFYVLLIEDKYDKIVFSERGQCDQSYMFFLFFSKTDPAWYQKQGGTVSGGFGKEHRFGKYEFRHIDWEQEAQGPSVGKILYVGDITDLPEGIAGLETFELLDGRKAIKVVAR